jgi:SAM-dependent methyltransferase
LAARWAEGGKDNLPAPSVVVGCVDTLPDAARYDTILYVDVLEHIERDGEELRMAARYLQTGGHLVILAPAHPWLFSPFDAAVGHFRRYTAAMLRSLTPAGTRLVRVAYLDSVGLLASIANRALLRSELPTQRQIRVWDSIMVPCSQVVDWVTRHRLGKSVIAVWKYGGSSA